MVKPPDPSIVVRTIDEAELAGWDFLGTRCECHSVYHPWRLLRRQTRYRRLDEIAARFRCAKCGRRPERVWLYWRGGRYADEERERVVFFPNPPHTD